jgi:O-antigen/teichoic acid export membrane protein
LIEADAKLARGAAALYFSNITTLVLNTLFLVLLANYYSSSQAEVGLVSFLNVVLVSASTVAVLALPLVGSGFATPPAVARFISLHRDSKEQSARSVYILSAGICAAISTTILLLSAYPPVASLVAGPAEDAAVFYACLDALVYSFAQLGTYAMLGYGRTTSAGKAIIASSILRYALASVLLLAGMGPSGVFIGFALGDSFLAVYSNYESVRDLRRLPSAKVPMGPVLKYMSSVFLAALMGLAVSQSDKLLAFLQLGLPTLAVYNIATVGAAVASFVPSAVTNVLVPSLGDISRGESERRAMLKAYTRHISLSAIPVGFLLAAVSPFLLKVFGEVYASGASVMAVIAIAIALTAVTAVYASTLLVGDRAHHYALSTVLGLVGLVAVAYLTVPAVGALGIAIGRGAMLFISGGLTAYFVWRTKSLVLDGAAYLRSLISSGLMAGVVYGLLALASAEGLNRLGQVLGSLVMIPVGFALYLLVMKLLKAYTVEDMDFLESLLPRWLGFLSRLARKLL